MFRVWLDTDIGSDVDDAVALLCALRHPEIQLVGVSTVVRPVGVRVWLAEEMLRRAQASPIAVLPGAVSPLETRAPAHGDSLPTYGHSAPTMPTLSPDHDEVRVAAIGAAMMAQTAPFHLVTIGPLTNVARLLTSIPEVSRCWESVTCMAGRLEGEAEYNVRADAPATRSAWRVFHPRVIGLEACSDTLTRAEAEEALDPADAASAFLLECYREYRTHANWLPDAATAPLTLFDAIALLSLTNSEAFEFQEVSVFVESDGRLRLTDDGLPVHYATKCDWGAMKPVIIELLRG